MRVFIETYGCAFNQADSDAIAQALRKAGHSIAKNEAAAQAVVLNTCGVKNATENRILHRLRQLAENGRKTIATGCLAQATPERVLAVNPRASIVGTFSQDKLAEAVAEERRVKLLDKTGFPEQHAAVEGVTARIQTARGCLGTCSFCQTKLARGGLQSIPPKTVLRLCEQAVANGARELLLTAQDTGCYGLDLQTNLAELVGEVTGIPGRFRVRVGMANPEHVLKTMPALLDAVESEKVYKFLHVPLQSGSDRVLKAMRRGHSAKDFRRAVSLFRKRFPDALIATD
ncbi:MAG: MiaB/RimO family radical SAM methylthiotransferase, partial [Candidatus Micrarchaeota archaeon]